MGRTQVVGDRGETRAVELLRGHGLRLVQRNFRCRSGEIDLVMRDAEVLVFVEVRYRADDRFGGALASIDQRKQRRLLGAAQYYLQHVGWSGPCRFDVVGLGAGDHAEWVRDAIQA
jgi:putative endonuclease